MRKVAGFPSFTCEQMILNCCIDSSISFLPGTLALSLHLSSAVHTNLKFRLKLSNTAQSKREAE
jgi:hypothetical protein